MLYQLLILRSIELRRLDANSFPSTFSALRRICGGQSDDKSHFPSSHRVQEGSGAHPASYPVGTRGSFPGTKAAGV
jgi:hypothetical protein